MSKTIAAPVEQRIGKYRILAELDDRDTIFTVEEPHTRRTVVLKRLSIDEMDRSAFLEEMQRWQRLEHANLVPILDVDEEAGEIFLVSEMLKGQTLHERLKREHRLPLTEALRIAYEIANVLVAAHTNGLVHRNLCPQNIWLEPSGRVRLIGIGHAPERENSSLLNRLDGPGLPGYLSPEQAAGEPLSSAADLFSLGCVLYQMVTGEPAFKGSNDTALFRAVIFNHPTSAKQINPEVPDELDEMLARMMAKLPSDRPDARQVEQRLQEYLDPSAPRLQRIEIPEPRVFPASKRVLSAIEALKRPPLTVETPTRVDIVVVPAKPERKGRRWLVDLIAATLLAGLGAALYLWWKASN